MPQTPGPHPLPPQRRTLTPELVDAERTYREMLFETFAFELRLGHRLGFVRAFASPRIAGLLAGTGEIERDPDRRGTDTGLFMYLLLHHGLDSMIGRRAVERLNKLHAPWSIRDEDYRWILSNWILPGLRVIDRYGWRPATEAERRAVMDWHRELGVRMGVREIPESVLDLEEWARAYERDNLAVSAAGRRLQAVVISVAVRSVPRPLRPLATRVGPVLIDEPVRTALGLPEPGPLSGPLVRLALWLRRAVRRWRGPGPAWFTPGAPRRDHPHGYTIEDLGPPSTREP